MTRVHSAAALVRRLKDACMAAALTFQICFGVYHMRREEARIIEFGRGNQCLLTECCRLVREEKGTTYVDLEMLPVPFHAPVTRLHRGILPGLTAGCIYAT